MTREIGSQGTDVAVGVAAALGLEILCIMLPEAWGWSIAPSNVIWTARRLYSTVGRSI